MKNSRKCSAMLAAGMGAAVCLSNGGAFAAKVTGSIKNSNGGHTVFIAGGPNSQFNIFNSLRRMRITAATNPAPPSSTYRMLGFAMGTGGINPTGMYAAMHNADVTINAGMAGSFAAWNRVPSNVSDKYLALRFNPSPYNFGWVHVVSTSAGAYSITVDKWGYNNTAGLAIKTLGESVTAKKLGLSDGTAKLLWSNANEDGIARYEAQTKDASGAWTTVSSDAPGASHYSATVPAGATCRIMVEKVDGATEEIGF